MVLYHFHSFGIMADAHNGTSKVFSSSNMLPIVRNRFSGPENLYIDTSLTSLGGVLTILDHFYSFGIMADTHNAPPPRFPFHQT